MNGKLALDPRAWLLWWIGASLPALLGRNPFMLAMALLAILTVRSIVQPAIVMISPGLLRLFVVFAAIGVVFNTLTVHAGDIVIWSIPEWVPIAGGDVTLNAVVYGLLGAVAILTLVLAGLTVAENVQWSTALRLLPDAFLSVGAASSIAFAFFPQMIASFREIREARLLRGAPVSSPLDYAGLIAPALSTGLDRAVTLSELLEVRSFGGSRSRPSHGSAHALFLSASIVLLVVGAFLFATGESRWAFVLGVAAVITLAGVAAVQRQAVAARTRYRPVIWTRNDSVVSVCSAVAVVSIILTVVFTPAGVRYEPYPDLSWPAVSLPLLVGLAFLTAPALLVLRRGEQ